LPITSRAGRDAGRPAADARSLEGPAGLSVERLACGANLAHRREGGRSGGAAAVEGQPWRPGAASALRAAGRNCQPRLIDCAGSAATRAPIWPQHHDEEEAAAATFA